MSDYISIPDALALKPEEIDAMEALFAFSAAMTEGGLSVNDLVHVMLMAIQDGHDMLQIQLTMASYALRLCIEAKENS